MCSVQQCSQRNMSRFLIRTLSCDCALVASCFLVGWVAAFAYTQPIAVLFYPADKVELCDKYHPNMSYKDCMKWYWPKSGGVIWFPFSTVCDEFVHWFVANVLFWLRLTIWNYMVIHVYHCISCLFQNFGLFLIGNITTRVAIAGGWDGKAEHDI